MDKPSPPHNTLFRSEVLTQQATLYYGAVSLIVPLRLRVLAAWVVLFTVSLALLLFHLEVSNTYQLQGKVVSEGDAMKVYTPKEGIVLHRNASEGCIVKKSQSLVEAKTAMAQIDVNPKQRQLVFALPLAQAAYVSEGERLTVFLDAFEAKKTVTAPAVVTHISKHLSIQSFSGLRQDKHRPHYQLEAKLCQPKVRIGTQEILLPDGLDVRAIFHGPKRKLWKILVGLAHAPDSRLTSEKNQPNRLCMNIQTNSKDPNHQRV